MTVGHEFKIMYPTVPKQARQSDAVLFYHLGGMESDWPVRESAGGLQVHWLRCIQGTAGLTSCRQSADNDATLALPGIGTMARSSRSFSTSLRSKFVMAALGKAFGLT